MPFTIRPYRRFPVCCPVTYNARLFLKLLLLICCSSFGLLITLLLLRPAPVYAEWVMLGETPGGVTIYVDPKTIRRKDDRVKLWYLFDFKTTMKEAPSSLSMKAQAEYNCREELNRPLAGTFFSGHMGKGEVVHDDSGVGEWQPVAPGSVGRDLWDYACGKK